MYIYNQILDKKGGLSNPRKSVVTTIENLQEEFDLVDIWRVKNPERKTLRGAKLLADFKYIT